MDKIRKAIPFISKTTNGEWALNPEAVKTLNDIHEPFGVVGICGTQRSYKSSMANLGIVGEDVFPVGNTTTPCTKGLYMCPTLIKRGKNVPFLVIDSEGISSLESLPQEDIAIMTMLFLSSDIFVYNTMRANSECLEMLRDIAAIFKRIRETNPEFEDLPLFLWILRDFNLLKPKKPNGNYMTDDEYIRDVLDVPVLTNKRKREDPKLDEKKLNHNSSTSSTISSSGSSSSNNNLFAETKEIIRESFRAIHGFLFGIPSTDPDTLQNIKVATKHRLNQEFQQRCDQFKAFLDSKVRYKTYCGKPMTGPVFVQYLNNCIQSLNRSVIPVVKGQHSTMIELSCKNSLSHCLGIVERTKRINRLVRKNYVPVTLLQTYFQKLTSHVKSCFVEMCFEPDRPSSKEFWKQVEIKIKEQQTKVLTNNNHNLVSTMNQWMQNFVCSSTSSRKLTDLLQYYKVCLENSRKEMEKFLFVTHANVFAFYKELYPFSNNNSETTTTTTTTTAANYTCSHTSSVFLQTAYSKLFDLHEKTIQDAKKQIQSFQVQLDETKEQCNQLEAKNKEQEVKLAENQSELEKLTNKVREVEHFNTMKVLEIEKLKKEKELTNQELQAQKNTLEDLTKQLTEHGNSKVEIESLKNQLQSAVNTNQELEKQSAKKEALDAEQWHLVQNQMNDYKKKLIDQKRSYDQKCQIREQKWKQLEETVKIQQQNLEVSISQIEHFKKQLQDKQSEYLELTNKYESLQKEFREELQQMNKKFIILQEEKTRLLLKCQNLENDEHNLKDVIQSLKQEGGKTWEMQKKLIELEQLEFQKNFMLQQQEQTIKKLQEDLQEKTHKLGELQKRLQSATSQESFIRNFYLKNLTQASDVDDQNETESHRGSA